MHTKQLTITGLSDKSIFLSDSISPISGGNISISFRVTSMRDNEAMLASSSGNDRKRLYVATYDGSFEFGLCCFLRASGTNKDFEIGKTTKLDWQRFQLVVADVKLLESGKQTDLWRQFGQFVVGQVENQNCRERAKSARKSSETITTDIQHLYRAKYKVGSEKFDAFSNRCCC